MYEQHWNMNRKPFENGFDPASYYPCEVHQGAQLKLRYAIESGREAVVLAGPSGTGKSLLCHALRRQLPEAIFPCMLLSMPLMPPDQLLAWLAEEMGAARADSALPASSVIRKIEAALERNAAQGRHAALIIDEAQTLLDTRALETVRLLLNLGHEGRSYLTVALVGQSSLLGRLQRFPALEERVGVKCMLRPFTLEETMAYVHHRLKAAGANRDVFENDALELLHQLSGGVPRRINRICDLALLVGFADERTTIGAAQIEAVSEELVNVAPD